MKCIGNNKAAGSSDFGGFSFEPAIKKVLPDEGLQLLFFPFDERRARGINLSLGRPKNQVVNDAVNAASNNGVVVVAAAGNFHYEQSELLVSTTIGFITRKAAYLSAPNLDWLYNSNYKAARSYDGAAFVSADFCRHHGREGHFRFAGITPPLNGLQSKMLRKRREPQTRKPPVPELVAFSLFVFGSYPTPGRQPIHRYYDSVNTTAQIST